MAQRGCEASPRESRPAALSMEREAHEVLGIHKEKAVVEAEDG